MPRARAHNELKGIEEPCLLAMEHTESSGSRG